ncbi:MAG: ZIP family metal transporter [Patescibacteria group bacterium]|jgi:zinc and cadmium transporter|nr:ZIP family metal transporter [Patescibacteria group bacterium]
MNNLILIILGTFLISLGSLIGVLTLFVNQKILNKVLLGLVGLSSGALLGAAFIHLMPEGVENLSPDLFFLIMLATILGDLLIEKLLHWRHCHSGPHCSTHTFGYMNLVGDSVHNFIDGLIIASSFAVNTGLGVSTVLAIALHEIPQEIGDFGVLLYAGFEKKKALVLNFLVALAVVAGGLAGWFLSTHIENITKFLVPVASGGFIYIALSDILPEIRKASGLKKFFSGFAFIVIGIAMMFFLRD